MIVKTDLTLICSTKERLISWENKTGKCLVSPLYWKYEVGIEKWLLFQQTSLLYLLHILQSDADYWLLSDADVSITDMWRTECILSLTSTLVSLFAWFNTWGFLKMVEIFPNSQFYSWCWLERVGHDSRNLYYGQC